MAATVAPRRRGGVWVVVVGGVVNVEVVGGGENVVVAGGASSCRAVVVVGLTLPPVDSRPGGIENGSLDPANDTGGSVSRGVGDGVTLGDSVGTPVLPVMPVGPLGDARSSPPSGFSTKRYMSSSRANATPPICRIF